MIINFYTFCQNPNLYLTYPLFLFYGPNHGKSEEIADIMINEYDRNNQNQYINLNSEVLNNNKNFLNETINSLDLFNKKKIIRCRLENPEILLKNFNFINEDIPVNNKIIIQSPELTKKNQIRKIFESNKNAICVPCYEDSIKETEKIIVNKLIDENITINNEIINYLSIHLNKNRHSLNQEITKLILFLKVNKELTIEITREILSDHNGHTIDLLIYAILSGKVKIIDRLYSSVIKNGSSNINILNSLTKHLIKLITFKENFKIYGNYKGALKKIFPPIFFKFENEFINQANYWSKSNIFSLLKKINKVEIELKMNYFPSNETTKFLIYFISRMSNKIIKKTT